MPSSPRTIVTVLVGLLVCSTVLVRAGENGSIQGKVTGKAKYLKDTVVHLMSVEGEFEPPEEPVIMDQKGMLFVPKVLPVLKGTTVRFLNNDPTEHSVFSPDHETYNLGVWGEGGSKTYTFDSLGVYTQLCERHPQMLGYIVVLDNPYFAVTNKDGEFRIDGVPPGEYEVTVWNERRRVEPQPVTVKAGAASAVELALVR